MCMMHGKWKMENSQLNTPTRWKCTSCKFKGEWALSHTEMYLNQFLSKLNRLLFFWEFEEKKIFVLFNIFPVLGKAEKDKREFGSQYLKNEISIYEVQENETHLRLRLSKFCSNVDFKQRQRCFWILETSNQFKCFPIFFYESIHWKYQFYYSDT